MSSIGRVLREFQSSGSTASLLFLSEWGLLVPAPPALSFLKQLLETKTSATESKPTQPVQPLTVEQANPHTK